MIRRIAYYLGWLNAAVWGLIMTYWVIMQWYAPNNTLTFYFNNHGEAFIEHTMGIILAPCTLYYLYKSLVEMRG